MVTAPLLFSINLKTCFFVMKFRNLFYCGAAVVMSAMVSCKSQSPEDIAGHWIIDKVNNEAIDMDGRVFMDLDVKDLKMSGNSGCNIMNAEIQLGGKDKITFGPVASTRMMCEHMDVEGRVLDAVSQVRSFEYSAADGKKAVVLKNEKGEQVLSLVSKDDYFTASNMDGDWTIFSVKGEELQGMENIPTLSFDTAENKVYGNLGCNRCNGELVFDGADASKVKFDKMATTMMFCQDMEKEEAIKAALGAVVAFEFDDESNLLLKAEDGAELLKLVRN